jgi:Flp pilus assembly pilin Flp
MVGRLWEVRRRKNPHPALYEGSFGLLESRFLGLSSFKRIVTDDKGATLVEYALIAVLIAVVCFAVITSVGQETSQSLNTASVSI